MSVPSSGLQQIPKRTKFSIVFYTLLTLSAIVAQWMFFSNPAAPEISYSDFRSAIEADQVGQVVLTAGRIYGRKKPIPSETSAGSAAAAEPSAAPMDVPATNAPWHLDRLTQWWTAWRGQAERDLQAREAEAALYFTVLPLEDAGLVDRLQAHGVDYRGRVESRWFQDFLMNWIVPFGVMFLVWGFIMRRMGSGPNVLQMGRSRAKIYAVDPKDRALFSDLAGVDEAIEETREVVEFLRDPAKYTSIGAKLPKGVLMVGPPGTGKTLLARAIAGEAGVAFFSLSGSDFVEMFVGVGAARVRDLFAEAKKSAPCIIFIDELDAIGRSRGRAGIVTGGFDERENTLNQLLVEMDGFDASTGVVILGATNRPEVLDPALLRAGRFDRRVVVDRPSRAGRAAIFRIHSRHFPLAPDIDIDALAAQTTGMVGADIANVCNEAALLATRAGRQTVEMRDFQEAVERTVAGPQRKSRVVTPKERERIAYHESGHALVAHLMPGGDPVQKISIIPRTTGALGYTLQTPLEDRYLLSEQELVDKIRVLLAGRAAEEVVFGDISTGASDDLAKANQIAQQMMTTYGMSENLPNVTLSGGRSIGYLGLVDDATPHADRTIQTFDDEIAALLQRCYDDNKSLIERDRAALNSLAETLLQSEEIGADEVAELIARHRAGAPPIDNATSGAA